MVIVIVLIVLAVLVIVGLAYVLIYNSFVRLRNTVAESWRQTGVELQRRYDLIPNLVAAAQQSADFERTTLDAVLKARAEAQRINTDPAVGVAATGAAEANLSGALSRVFAVAENYPQLGSVAAFVNVQKELSNTEDRIAAGRRFYNGNVRALNTKIETVPTNIVASIHKITKAEYFQESDQAHNVPQVAPRLTQ